MSMRTGRVTMKEWKCIRLGLLLPGLAFALALVQAGCSSVTTVRFPTERVPAGPSRDACLRTEIRTFGALETEIDRLEASPPATSDESCELALLYVKAGRVAEAEEFLHRILGAEPLRVGAALLLTRVYRQTGRDEEAETLLEQTARVAPADLRLRLFQAEDMEDEEAARAFDAILEDHPESVEALVGSATQVTPVDPGHSRSRRHQ